ncbi:MAG: SDR family oxidoreductase [Lentisphaeria bacterium]
MPHILNSRTVLVTGGAKRIGRAICRAFAEHGATVIIHYRHSQAEAEALREELRQHGDDHVAIQADLTIPEQRRKLIARSLEINGQLDFLVNNASVYRRSRLRDVNDEEARKDFDINFFAPFALMRDFANCKGNGSIINLLDQRVAKADPAAGTYGLAKKALRDATEAAAVEWAPEIRVNGISPGVVLPPPGVSKEKMVPILKGVPMQTNTTPEEIANACIYLATAETVTGTILNVDGGLHLVTPLHGEKRPS